MVLAFHLATRAAGRAAGGVAVVALLASSDWLRYMLAGNIEPVVAALLLGAIALHLSKRMAGAFVLGALAGAARPEVWLLVGCYAAYLWRSEGRRWPLTVAIPCMLALWIVPDWASSGSPLHTLHSATVSHEPRALQLTNHPALELVKGGAGILPAPVWLAASAAVVLGWRTRDRTTLALAVVAGAWAIPTIAATALGYPAVPRYLAEPAVLCCPLAGAAIVAVARLPSHTRTRIVLVAVLLALSAPFAIARVAGLGRQASAAEQGGEDLASLWQAVDRTRALAPIGRLHPAIEPGASANALVWKLGLKLDEVAGTLSPPVQVAFLKGDERAAAARLHARGAASTPLTGAGPWHVLTIHWARPRRVVLSSRRHAHHPLEPSRSRAAPTRALVGRSEAGRAIVAVRVGNPRGTRVLVVGCIHGNECAGISITRNLARAPTGADVWIVPDLNPDGHAHGTRQDGRGVDLNANWSAQWHRGGHPGDTYYAGPRPFSERGSSDWVPSPAAAASSPSTRGHRRLEARLRPSQATAWSCATLFPAERI
jgi:Zinc carboxypeptidase